MSRLLNWCMFCVDEGSISGTPDNQISADAIPPVVSGHRETTQNRRHTLRNLLPVELPCSSDQVHQDRHSQRTDYWDCRSEFPVDASPAWAGRRLDNTSEPVLVDLRHQWWCLSGSMCYHMRSVFANPVSISRDRLPGSNDKCHNAKHIWIGLEISRNEKQPDASLFLFDWRSCRRWNPVQISVRTPHGVRDEQHDPEMALLRRYGASDRRFQWFCNNQAGSFRSEVLSPSAKLLSPDWREMRQHCVCCVFMAPVRLFPSADPTTDLFKRTHYEFMTANVQVTQITGQSK